MLKKWEDLPDNIRVLEVRPYYDKLKSKPFSIFFKRLFDFTVSLIFIVVLLIPMAFISVWIKIDSKGSVLYRQKRVTSYGKVFKIHKFRTMVSNADKIGTHVTVEGDARITRVGKKLRRLRLDELPQLFDVLQGNMSFVGTRPEAVKYVNQYKPEYYATLLMPAGITSEASIRYKDEDALLKNADDIDRVYIEDVLPDKMKWNLKSIENFNFFSDILTMFKTVFAIFGRDYSKRKRQSTSKLKNNVEV